MATRYRGALVGAMRPPRLTDLPHEVSATILQEWLGNWKTVSKLDVAFCNKRRRRDYHAILSHQVLKMQDDSNVLETIARKKHLNCYLSWVRSRAVRIFSLYMNIRFIPDVVAIGPFDFPNIARITFIGDKKATVATDALRAFLAYFPSVCELDCSRWNHLPNTQLALLGSLPSSVPLRVLNLDHCDEVMGVTVCSLAAKHAPSLRELRCVVLDDDELRAVAEACHGLTTLSLACDELTEDAVLEACRANPGLEALTLGLYDHGQPSVISDNLLIRVTAACPCLRAVHVETNGGVGERSFAWIVRNCPELRVVKTFGYQYAARGTPPRAELVFGLVADVGEIKQVIAHTLLPIVHVSAKYAKVKLDAEALQLIADRCGLTLTHLSGDVDEEVTTHSVEYLLSRCPRLQTLMLSKFGSLTNDVLERVPRWCPQLRVLGVECAKKVTDAAMLRVLDAYPAHQLTSLGLHYCRALSIAVVRRAAERCPRLDWLLVQGTAVHRDIVWDNCVKERKIRFSAKSTLVTGHKKWFEKEIEAKVPARSRPGFRIW